MSIDNSRALGETWRDDEQLEILFSWIGGDSQHPIEAGLEEFLDADEPVRRRRLRVGRGSRGRAARGPAPR